MGNKYSVKNVFIHCSASYYGNALIFDEWHKAREWSGIGYHYVVLNGRPFADVNYFPFLDGEIQPGRHFDDDPIFSPDEVGAHVAGRNGTSVGICLVGDTSFTKAQLTASKFLVLSMLDFLKLGVDDVLGHYEDVHTHKTCPNINCDDYRDFLRDKLHVNDLISRIATYNEALKHGLPESPIS